MSLSDVMRTLLSRADAGKKASLPWALFQSEGPAGFVLNALAEPGGVGADVRAAVRQLAAEHGLTRVAWHACSPLSVRPLPIAAPARPGRDSSRSVVRIGSQIQPHHLQWTGSNAYAMVDETRTQPRVGCATNHHVARTLGMTNDTRWRRDEQLIHAAGVPVGYLNAATRMNGPSATPAFNTVDFAHWIPDAGADVDLHEIPGLGEVVPEAADVKAGDEVWMPSQFGLRRGQVVAGSGAVARVTYDEGVLLFEDLIAVRNANLEDPAEPFSQPGTSGSGVFLSEGDAKPLSVVGLHFAGGPEFSFEARIANILRETGFRLATSEDAEKVKR